uniref:AB hydrolase-1 domain-containing protein n=2 Tax=Oryza brachyantha TaxID=4533 RepID=J3LPD5_ORYBR
MPSCFLRDYINVMGSDHNQEKTELLHTLINGRKLSDLPKINQPTLIIWGEQDQVFPMELAHRLQSHLKENSRLVVIKNAGHAVNLEKSKEVCRNIIEYLREPVSIAPNAALKVDTAELGNHHEEIA